MFVLSNGRAYLLVHGTKVQKKFIRGNTVPWPIYIWFNSFALCSAESMQCRTEEDVFRVLDLEYKEPWNRNTFDNADITRTDENPVSVCGDVPSSTNKPQLIHNRTS